MPIELDQRIREQLSHGRVRFLAYGSSNTERYLPGMHWFDCVHLGFTRKYGKVGQFLNTGSGGDTTEDLLNRFDLDAGFFKPHFVFLTIGGNDSRVMDVERFGANLRELYRRFEALDTKVILQTYYAPDSTEENPHCAFYNFSDCVRQVAGETGSYLIDNLRRWLPFRAHHYDLYQTLMLDEFHLNEGGNRVYGYDIARSIGCPLEEPDTSHWSEAIRVQQLMDERSL